MSVELSLQAWFVTQVTKGHVNRVHTLAYKTDVQFNFIKRKPHIKCPVSTIKVSKLLKLWKSYECLKMGGQMWFAKHGKILVLENVWPYYRQISNVVHKKVTFRVMSKKSTENHCSRPCLNHCNTECFIGVNYQSSNLELLHDNIWGNAICAQLHKTATMKEHWCYTETIAKNMHDPKVGSCFRL